MHDILKVYQNRLVNISGRNRSLVMKRLYKKRSFDLVQIDQFFDNYSSEFLGYLIRDDRRPALLLDDPYRDQPNREMATRDELDKRFQEKMEELRKSDFQNESEYEVSVEQLMEEHKKQLQMLLRELEKRHKALITLSTDLNYLAREIELISKETGRQELFVGYPFVEGTLFDGTFVRGPLLLFPVRMNKDKNKWYLERFEGTAPRLNKVFVFAHAKSNDLLPPELEWELSEKHPSAVELVVSVLEYLEDHGINIVRSANEEIEAFANYTNDNLPDYPIGKLVIKNHLILGQFPTANSIYADYTRLMQKSLEGSSIAQILHAGEQGTSNTPEEKEQPLREGDFFFITPLDYSQEKAVQKASQISHLVIHGPPGTGKSETISNIISDSFAKKKRVLMVSQKRASLDVVHNRLAPLHSKMVLIHDGDTAKKSFYNHVFLNLEELEKDRHEPPRLNINSVSKQIDYDLDLLERSWVSLHTPHKCGLTLQQMYTKASLIDDEESLIPIIVKLEKSNLFGDYRYNDLQIAKNILATDGELEAYFSYRILDTISSFRFVKEYVDRIAVLTAQEVLKELDTDIPSGLKQDRWYDKSLGRLKAVSFSVSEQELIKIASDLVNEEFPGLLLPCHDGKWWTLSYWVKYRKNKNQQLENKREYEQHRTQVKELLVSICSLKEQVYNEFRPLECVFSSEGIEHFARSVLDGEDPGVISSQIQEILDQAENYSNLRSQAERLPGLSRVLADFVYSLGKPADSSLVGTLEKVLQAILLVNLRQHEKDLGAHELVVDGETYQRKTEQIRELMKQKRSAVPEMICGDWSRCFSGKKLRYKDFKYHAGKKSWLWPLRRYVAEFQEEILTLFPCWLMGPESVSDILPLTAGLFDVVIFDEASQMFIENSIPAIYRARQVIVAGDDKQLRPDDTFTARLGGAHDDQLDVDDAAAMEVESLLDLAIVNCDDVRLNYHYRSRYSELINFSNYGFYQAGLHVSPNTQKPDTPPIERIKVDGRWTEERNNHVEANRVVDLIEQLLRTRREQETIGVVTFNYAQRDLIQDLLDHKASNDPAFAVLYRSECNRLDGNQDVSLFVKNIENVQGDERDVIIFSIAYGPDQYNKIRANFGTLNRQGGANRLNVAVSRAKKKIYVVTSIEPEELNVDNTKHDGPKYLKKYLQYAREISQGNTEEAMSILVGMLDTGVATDRYITYDSEFERQVADALRSAGFEVHPQVGVSGYRIDLGVYDTTRSRYILGIECDGATYHSSKSARERDIHRQSYLESRGWTIARIWSTDWRKNPKGEIQRIVEMIKKEQDKFEGVLDGVKLVPLIHDSVAENTIKTVSEKPKEGPQRHQVAKAKSAVKSVRPILSKEVSFGDKVWLTSDDGAVVFPIDLEDNPHNEHLMKDYERELLGKHLDDEIKIGEHVYRISRIELTDHNSSSPQELGQMRLQF